MGDSSAYAVMDFVCLTLEYSDDTELSSALEHTRTQTFLFILPSICSLES